LTGLLVLPKYTTVKYMQQAVFHPSCPAAVQGKFKPMLWAVEMDAAIHPSATVDL
jgi:hypothetical protein